MGTQARVQDGYAVQRRSLLRALGAGAVASSMVGASAAGAKSSTPKETGVFDVAIIGAGLAGLTAARDLKRAGCSSFVVVEARDRVGGRTVNHEIGDGVIAEGGGQWIGPGQTAIFDLAEELGVETFDSYYQGRSVSMVGEQKFEEDSSSGGRYDNNPLVDKINAMAKTIDGKAPWNSHNAADLDHVSVAEWLEAQSPNDLDRVTFFLSTTLTYGSPPDKLSLLQYLTLINSAKNDLARVEAMKDGMQETRLVGGSWILSKKLADEVEGHIRLSSPVQTIGDWDKGVVTLHTPNGIIHARQVIVAMSPSLCNRIAFDPPLPAERQAMHREWPTIAHMRKTVHVYDKPFWRERGYNGQVLDITGPLLWSADNSPPDGSVGILVGFVRDGSLSDDPAVAGPALSAIYAKALGDEALKPLQYHEIDWGNEEWSLSCTSPYPPGFLTRYGKIMREPVGALQWSGTDMAERFASAMDGAVRSGHQSALSALAALSRS